MSSTVLEAGRSGARTHGATIPRWRLAMLPAVILLVGVVTFHPYWNVATEERRDLPTHMDEYVHWESARVVLETGEIDAPNPFTTPLTDLNPRSVHERGFPTYIAAFHDATGIPFEAIFKFGPAIVAMVAALAVFVVAERWGAGIESALWVAAVPTTLRFLGPGFLVPIAWTLPVLAFGLHVVLHQRGFRAYVTLALLCAATWPIHAMGAFLLVAFCSLEAALSFRTPSRSAALIGAAAGPALLMAPFLTGEVGFDHAPKLPPSAGLLHVAGIGLFLSAAVGAMLLALRKSTFRAGIVLGASLMVGEFILLRRATTDLDPFRLYDRTFTVLPFLAAIAAGVTFAHMRQWLTRRPVPRSWVATAIVLLLLTQTVLVAQAAQRTMTQDRYAPVTAERFNEYLSLRDVLPPGEHLAIVEGQTMPFSIATGIPTLFVLTPTTDEVAPESTRFFEGRANDTLFLINTGTTIVVTSRQVENPYLVRISESTYILRDDVRARMG